MTDFHCEDNLGKTALHWAASSGLGEACKAILSVLADPWHLGIFTLPSEVILTSDQKMPWTTGGLRHMKMLKGQVRWRCRVPAKYHAASCCIMLHLDSDLRFKLISEPSSKTWSWPNCSDIFKPKLSMDASCGCNLDVTPRW